jgi:linoleate 10R-lipoxygenase
MRGLLIITAVFQLCIDGIVDALLSLFEKPKNVEGLELVHRLQALGRSHDEIANSILAILVGFTVELTIGTFVRHDESSAS